MKENRKNNYLIKYVIVLAILIAMTVIAFAIPTGVGLIGDDKLQEISSSNLTNTAFNVNYPTAGELGQFDNGVTYVYTDPTKVDDFRSGAISRDITEVTVDTSKPHGTSQQNPYVISTLADWDNFVKRMATGTAYGAGEYFVLANDLDFTGEAFHPVRNFKGNFYGIGYALKNISCSSWQYWNGSDYVPFTATNYGYGVFCNTIGTVITDLIIEDYEYLDIHSTSAFVGDRGSCVGGVVGYSTGECYILNCHAIGSISSHNVTYSVHTPWGGIIGEHYSSAPTTIYRCSAMLETYANYSGNWVPIFGGIMGESFFSASASIHIYDCVASIKSVIASSSYTHIGSIGGIIYGKTFCMENIVADNVITANGRSASGAMMYTNNMTSMELSNIYLQQKPKSASKSLLPHTKSFYW